MPEGITHATIVENGNSVFAVTINVSGHVLQGDEPVVAGGGDMGPAPYDLLTAALGECTAMTVRWYARQQNWPLEKVEVEMSHRQEPAEGRPGKVDIFDKRIRLFGAALTDEQRQKLVEVAAKCPVQRSLQNNPVITISEG